MPDPPGQNSTGIAEFIEPVKGLFEVGDLLKGADPKTRDALREKERDSKYKINSLYWQVAFERVAQRIQGKPNDPLLFEPLDRLFLNFGWIDDRLVARQGLQEETLPPDALFKVLYLTEWFNEEEGRFLDTDTRIRLDTRSRSIGSDLVKCDEGLKACLRAREQALSACAGDRDGLLTLYEELESHRIRVHELERTRRQRSLTREEVNLLGESNRELARITPALATTFAGKEDSREPLEKIHEQILSLHRRRIELDDQHKASQVELTKAEDVYNARLAERRQHMQEKLVEIREDIKLCAKWAKCEAYSCLFAPAKWNTKKDVIETVAAIEDFDPTVFQNRRVERTGRPTFLITPGVGHGSYDFRSNTIVLPLVSPRDRLESVAYAIALYRRDLDKVANDGKLWESFFSDQVWRGIKDKEKPTSFTQQMNEFVADYVLWITREARGMMVLESEIRRWFETNIAPERRSPMVPRDLRAVKPADRLTKAQELRKDLTGINAYKIGVLAWLSGRVGDAHGWFVKAGTLDPENLEILWSLGVVHSLPEQDLKAGDAGGLRSMSLRERLTKAKEAMDKFVKLSKPSWWLLKAQDHLRKISEQLAQMAR